jgi:hypothetical protein
MSKSVVSHYCSILNYLKHNHEELYELIQDLCIGRIFNPRKGKKGEEENGITFLCPDSTLLAQLKKQAGGSDPETAVATIQSLVVTQWFDLDSSLSGDLPVAARDKKITVKSAGNGKAELEGGAELSKEKGWMARNDRPHSLMVHTLSGSFPKVSEGKAEAKPRAKKGGADLNNKTRQQLFLSVLRQTCKDTKRNPPAELLVDMLDYFGEQKEHEDCCNCIKSQLSGDALVSLAIVLQPWKATHTYVSDNALKAYCDARHNPNFNLFCWEPKPIERYNNYMNDYSEKCGKVKELVASMQEKVVEEMSKATAVAGLTNTYSKLPNNLRGVNLSVQEMYAEAELRVRMALLRLESNNQKCLSFEECLYLFSECKLDQPVLFADAKEIGKSNVGFYYSSVYLLARSDGFFYLPGLGSGWNQLQEGDGVAVMKDDFISLAPQKLTDSDQPYEILGSLKK